MSRMAIKNTDIEIGNVYEDVSDKKLVLPRFQRGFVWPRDKQTNLIASFLVDLPFGSLLCLNGNQGDFITRQLCFTSIIDNSNGSVDYLLDGQQRLSTLRSVIYDIYNEEGIEKWEETWTKLYSQLRNRWYLRVIPDKEEEDILGYNDLTSKNLNQFTDTDIKDFIEFKVINKTKDKDKSYHPAFDLSLKKQTAPERAKSKRHRIECFAADGLIPLYEVYNGDKGLHCEVIEKIAQDKIDILKEVFKEGISAQSILDTFNKYGKVDNIEVAEELFYLHEDSQEKFHEKINDMWADIKAKWVQKLVFDLSQLLQRKIPIIKLDKAETNRAIAIFEAINKGGINLSVFDLTVAKAASEQGSDLVSSISKQLNNSLKISSLNDEVDDLEWMPDWMDIIDGDEPSAQFKDWFVNVLSLHIYVNVNKDELKGPAAIKREAILSLDSKLINQYAPITTLSICRALAFLNIRCGVTKAKDIQFKLLLIVIAHFLSDDAIWNDKKSLNKIEYWYWTSVFSGEYTYRQNERCIEDIKLLKDFLKNEDVTSSPIYRRRKNLLDFKGCTKEIMLRQDDDIHSESNSIKMILLQFILSKRPWDFLTKEKKKLQAWAVSKQEYDIEIHHVYPLTGATKIEQSTKEIRKDPNHILNSMLNLTYISRTANQVIKDRPASEYLKQLEVYEHTSHCISSDSTKSITNDNDLFICLEHRYSLIIQAIQSRLDVLV